MSQKWRAATKACEDAKQKGHPEEDLALAAGELESFLASSDGQEALAMLRVSGRHITVAETDGDGGHGLVYAVTGDGLVQSFEAKGMWTGYSDNVPAPQISCVEPIKFVEEVCGPMVTRPRQPGDILQFIIDEIDRIADQIQRRAASKRR